MKLYSNLNEEVKVLNLLWFRQYLALLIWTCCCYQGDEARPTAVNPPIACETIIGETPHPIGHDKEACNWCKCRTWCNEDLKIERETAEDLISPQQNSVLELLASSCRACCSLDPSPTLNTVCECQEVVKRESVLAGCDAIVAGCCWVLCSSKHHRGKCFYHHLNSTTYSVSYETLIEKFESQLKNSGEKHEKARKERSLGDDNTSSPPLSVRPSSQTLPISPRENETLSPAAGVIIYDEMTGKPADKNILSGFTWDARLSLLYPDIYPGHLAGQTAQIISDGRSEILFEDVLITDWGYSYLLQIEVAAAERHTKPLTLLLGPFDVDMVDTFEQPLVDSDEFREVKIVFEGIGSNDIRRDERKFKIFFLNRFGRRYSRVRWKNATLLGGSLVVNSIITGLAHDLEATSRRLSEDIEKGEADVTYEGNILRASRVFLPSRKLLEESSTEDEGGAGGLSVAWIVAIVVNVVLILVFIIAIVYCYCRRKRQRDISHSNATLRKFNGGPDPLLFANKAENLQEKAAIFTVEDSRARMEEEEEYEEDEDRKCNCASPKCYCSVGDGRKSDMTLHHTEENEEDPQGYPTPSPEPKFPTPEPTPEPEDFWRPDSTPQPEEEEPEEEMFLPGAVSEPTPEPQEERFYVYLLTDVDGSRELVGQIYLRIDGSLSEARRSMDRDRDLSDAIGDREYRFLDENLDGIPQYQESSMDLERVYPSQGINIQFLPRKDPTPEPQPRRPQVPAYVGPLGICNAAQCTRAAKIRCLDCRNVAYCSKRCMREDARDHKRVCYKPAWRL